MGEILLGEPDEKETLEKRGGSDQGLESESWARRTTAAMTSPQAAPDCGEKFRTSEKVKSGPEAFRRSEFCLVGKGSQKDKGEMKHHVGALSPHPGAK